MTTFTAHLAATLRTLGVTVRDRLEAARHDETGASAVETAIIIGVGVVLAITLVGILTGAFNKYAADIR